MEKESPDSPADKDSTPKTKTSRTKLVKKRSFNYVAVVLPESRPVFSQKKHKMQLAKKLKKRDVVLKEECLIWRNMRVEPHVAGRTVSMADQIFARGINKVAARRAYGIRDSLSRVPDGKDKTPFPFAPTMFYNDQKCHGKYRKKMSDDFLGGISSFTDAFVDKLCPNFFPSTLSSLESPPKLIARTRKSMMLLGQKLQTRPSLPAGEGEEKCWSGTGNVGCIVNKFSADAKYVNKICPEMSIFFSKKVCHEEEAN